MRPEGTGGMGGWDKMRLGGREEREAGRPGQNEDKMNLSRNGRPGQNAICQNTKIRDRPTTLQSAAAHLSPHATHAREEAGKEGKERGEGTGGAQSFASLTLTAEEKCDYVPGDEFCYRGREGSSPGKVAREGQSCQSLLQTVTSLFEQQLICRLLVASPSLRALQPEKSAGARAHPSDRHSGSRPY